MCPFGETSLFAALSLVSESLEKKRKNSKQTRKRISVRRIEALKGAGKFVSLFRYTKINICPASVVAVVLISPLDVVIDW